MQNYARIIGTGSYLPAKIVTNHDLAQRVDTSDTWIVERSGIRQRHVAADGEQTSDLAYEASRRALDAAGVAPGQLGLMIVATTTPDQIFPSTACILQNRLGASGFPALDVQAVCAGFIYALSIADLFVRDGRCDYALVVGAEIYSRILDWNDRSTCVLFGDGAAAVVLRRDARAGVLATKLHADGGGHASLCVPGSVRNGVVSGTPFVRMQGPVVFKLGVRVMAEASQEALDAAGVAAREVDWFVPHQANIRIMRATAEKLGIAEERMVTTVERHANTSAASVPLALDAAVRDGRIKSGNTVLCAAVGGGFAWGAGLIRW